MKLCANHKGAGVVRKLTLVISIAPWTTKHPQDPHPSGTSTSHNKPIWITNNRTGGCSLATKAATTNKVLLKATTTKGRRPKGTILSSNRCTCNSNED